jgi:enoyl-CoA hydratase
MFEWYAPAEMTHTMNCLLVEIADGVATLTLNRPEARNALDAELRTALAVTVPELDHRPDVRAIVLTGADPAFCAGIDLREMSSEGERSASPATPVADLIAQRGPFPRRRTPLIGAINGATVTGGLELALACDFLVASERARFADTHARVNVMPGWGLTVRLPEAIGLRRAKQMSLTGNYVDAPTALVWGLVNLVVVHDELLPTARKIASDIASVSPASVGEILAIYDDEADARDASAWDIETPRSLAWLRDQFDRGALNASREAIQARGRSQI